MKNLLRKLPFLWKRWLYYNLHLNVDEPYEAIICIECGHVSNSAFMRWRVYSGWRKALGLPCYAVICEQCKRFMHYEYKH